MYKFFLQFKWVGLWKGLEKFQVGLLFSQPVSISSLVELPKILIIAGSDSSAGAGVQADIKTASAHKVYASTVITSITSQNTLGVQGVFDIPPEVIKSQIESVMSDIGASHIKLGMLSNIETINAVAEDLNKYPKVKIIADPVMVAKGGSKLLQVDAIENLKSKILNNAYLITPNIPEAEELSGLKILDRDGMLKALEKMSQSLNSEYILLKGGHLQGEELVDILYSVKDDEILLELVSEKIATKNTHGTGCSYASAVTSNLALENNIVEAVRKAHGYIKEAIKKAPKNIGKGHGPVYHWL